MATFLVVDDEVAVQRLLVAILQSLDHEAIVASNGSEGLAAFNRHTINCVITDLAMPGMDGIEMIGRVRQLNSDVPIIVITGSSNAEFQQLRNAHLAQLYLEKPIKLAVLAETIELILHRE